MSINGSAVCVSFLSERDRAVHDLSTDVIKMALFTNSATLNALTTAYSTTGESSGTGYTAGGKILVLTQTTVGLQTVWTFANPIWTGGSPGSFTARGALIYNSSKSNKAICVLDFGSDKTPGATGNLEVQAPPATVTDGWMVNTSTAAS